jgi:hypothetical protein
MSQSNFSMGVFPIDLPKKTFSRLSVDKNRSDGNIKSNRPNLKIYLFIDILLLSYHTLCFNVVLFHADIFPL